MKSKSRTTLLAVVMVCFTLTATNAVLVLHLAEHHKDKSHDPEHCPICKQAAVNIAKAVLPNPPPTTKLPLVIEDICTIHNFTKDFEFITPYMRAPPVAA